MNDFAVFRSNPSPPAKPIDRPARRPNSLRRRVWLALLPLCLMATPLSALTEYLDGEFWTDEDRIIHEGEAQAELRLLREGRYVFSGMLYGYDFRYVPSDRTRQVEEEFTLEPVAEIPWGDPQLRVVGTRRRSDGAFVARMRYDMAPFQNRRYEAWRRNTRISAAGKGAAPLLEGLDGKIRAIEEGVKQAVRGYMRTKTFNKPRLITGRVLLEEPPRVFVSSGEYVATVELFLLLEDVEHYAAY